ncbi:hypothetical protein T484DRAFT_1755504 [Baffinella frigidus]|nr:hypothetical protein T484DRAFT_1755504 [Cryptophyta sp. CCMP2293]
MTQVKNDMTKAGHTMFEEIHTQMGGEESCFLESHYRGLTADDPEFVIVKVRSDVFKGIVTTVRVRMDKESMKKVDEVCMKPPPCMSSVHEYMPVLVPSFIMKKKPLTWMSALTDIPDIPEIPEIPEIPPGDGNKKYRDSYYELLIKMVAAYHKVKIENNDPLEELKMNDPDRVPPYGGDDGTPWASGTTEADTTEADTSTALKRPTNKAAMRQIHEKRVKDLEKAVTNELKEWFDARQSYTDTNTDIGLMENYGFRKGLEFNGFVTMVINQAAAIGTCTWGNPTVMCNTLEIKQDGYKVLYDWLETYAQAFVKLHEGQYAVSHNHHLTEDEHTVQVATAIWIIAQASVIKDKPPKADPALKFSRKPIPLDHHFNALKFMAYAESLDCLVAQVRKLPMLPVKQNAVAVHLQCMQESVTNKLLHALTKHVNYTTGVFDGTGSSIVQDTILANNFCVMNSHLFANQGILQECKMTTLHKDLKDLNLFKVYSIKVDGRLVMEQGPTGVGVMRRIQKMCSYYETRSLLHRLGVGLVSKADARNVIDKHASALKRSMGWWISWYDMVHDDMCVPPVADSRFDKTYLVKSVEKSRHSVGTGDHRPLKEIPAEEFKNKTKFLLALRLR